MFEGLSLYLLGLALPLILWMLLIAFRWRYLRHVRSTIYSPVTPGSLEPNALRARQNVPPLPVKWLDATLEAERPAPRGLLDALEETRTMRAALAAAGAVYIAAATAVVWQGQTAAGISARAAVALAYFSTIVGLMLIVAFTGRGWKNWIAAAAGWVGAGFVLLVWPLRIKPLLAISLIADGLHYASVPLVCMAPLVMRTIRPLLAGFVPMVGLWFACAAVMGLALELSGLSLVGHYTFSTILAGLLSAASSGTPLRLIA